MTRTIAIAGKATIGNGRTFIIAEVGSNHAGDLQRAKDCILAAAEAGADAVKFQSVDIDQLYVEPSAKTRDLHRKIDMEERWHLELMRCCDSAGVMFFSSPTYMRAVDILETVGTDLYKLASAQVGVFPQLVEKVAKLGKPTLLSTGLVTYGGLERVVNIFRACGNNRFVILHCNAIYPTSPDRVCLGRMDAYRKLFDCPVGFSDHTQGISVSLAAVARGADVIEKHFTLSKDLNTPDAFFSAEPAEFAALVNGVRAVEAACAPCAPRLEIEIEEQSFKDAIRYRLVLLRCKKKNDLFAPGDFEYKRHTFGMDCMEEPVVIRHMRATRSIDAGEILDWGMLEGRQ